MFAFRKIINARFLTYLLTWCIYKCFTTKTFQSHAAEIQKNIPGVHYSLSHWSRLIPAALTIIVTNYVLKTDRLVPRPFTPRFHRQRNHPDCCLLCDIWKLGGKSIIAAWGMYISVCHDWDTIIIHMSPNDTPTKLYSLKTILHISWGRLFGNTVNAYYSKNILKLVNRSVLKAVLARCAIAQPSGRHGPAVGDVMTKLLTLGQFYLAWPSGNGGPPAGKTWSNHCLKASEELFGNANVRHEDLPSLCAYRVKSAYKTFKVSKQW